MSDLAVISELSAKAFQQYGPYEDILPEWFVSGITRTLLALRERKAVGFVMLGRPANKWFYPQATELLAIAVAPEWQNQGIGSRLLGTALSELQGRGVEQVVLHTAVVNSSGQRLFRKYGFVAAGKKRCFYPAGQDAVMMYKNMARG